MYVGDTSKIDLKILELYWELRGPGLGQRGPADPYYQTTDWIEMRYSGHLGLLAGTGEHLDC